MTTEHRPIEYTDDNPMDVSSPMFDSLLYEIHQRVEKATADLGDFGISMTADSRDGSFSFNFGPNMLVNWDVLAALPAPRRVGPR